MNLYPKKFREQIPGCFAYYRIVKSLNAERKECNRRKD